MIGEKYPGFAALSAFVFLFVMAASASCRRAEFSGVMPMQVEVDVYSGRPNPRWDLSAQQAGEFLKMVRALPKAEHDSALNEGLGYRGLKVTGSALSQEGYKEIVISNGIVAVREESGSQQLTDKDRALERWLLQTGKGKLEEELYKYLSEETLK
jgi:hypothetical protein